MSYTKQTWASGDVVTAEKLNHMEDGIGSAATAELPAVSATDNGDVLTVVDGAWGKAAPSGGGGGVFYVDADLTMDESGPVAGEPNHTFAETLAAYEAGQTVMMRFTHAATSSVYVCPLILTQEINGVQGISVMAFLMYLEVFWAVGFVFDGTIAFNRIGV